MKSEVDFQKMFMFWTQDSKWGGIMNLEWLIIVVVCFPLAVVDELRAVFGAGRVSIKLSPVGRMWYISDSDPVTLCAYLLREEVGIRRDHELSPPRGGRSNHLGLPRQAFYTKQRHLEGPETCLQGKLGCQYGHNSRQGCQII